MIQGRAHRRASPLQPGLGSDAARGPDHLHCISLSDEEARARDTVARQMAIGFLSLAMMSAKTRPFPLFLIIKLLKSRCIGTAFSEPVQDA